MSNCNPFKISLKSLYSYDDLTDLPSINGVEVRGDLSLEDLGLDTWLAVNTRDFITQNDLESMGFVTETGLNSKGFVTDAELSNKGFVTETELDNKSFVTENELNGKGFVTESELSNKDFVTNTELSGKSFVTESSLEESLSDFIVSSSTGKSNQNGFTIAQYTGDTTSTAGFDTYQMYMTYSSTFDNTERSTYVSPYSVSVMSTGGFQIDLDPFMGVSLMNGDVFATLDAYTLQALISLLG